MASQVKLIIPNGRGKGSSIYQELLSFSLGSLTNASAVSGVSGGAKDPNKGGEATCTMEFSDDTRFFYDRVFDGESIPLMKVEMVESTPTTLKAQAVFEFARVNISSFNLSNGARPIAMISFLYDGVKTQFL